MLDVVMIGEMLRLGDGDGDSEPAALAAAQSKSGDALGKLETYVRCHSSSGAYHAAADSLKRAMTYVFLVTAVIVVVLGGLAALSAFESSVSASEAASAVNVFWLLGALLGVHVLSVLLWAAFLWREPQTTVSLLGSLASLVKAISKRSPLKYLAAQSYGHTHLSGWAGRWRLSALSHGLWLLYLVAGLIACVFLLSIKSFSFVWETTLLDPETAIAIVQTLGKPIAALGWSVPSESAIRAAQSVSGTSADASSASIWAKFCIAALVLYGIVPRLILWAVSAFFSKRAHNGRALPLSDPYFAGILARIYQPVASSEIIDHDDAVIEAAPGAALQPSTGHLQADPEAVLIGWEIDGGSVSQPGNRNTMTLCETPQALVRAVGAASGKPVTLVVSALNTPDRGVAAALKPFQDLEARHKSVWVIDMAALKERGGAAEVKRRLGDWWSLFTKLGFDQTAITLDERALS